MKSIFTLLFVFVLSQGFSQTGYLSGQLYYDNNGNGIKDEGELGIPFVSVSIDSESIPFAVVETDWNGYWEAYNVPVGEATSEIDISDPHFPFDAVQTEGTNPTTSIIVEGENQEVNDGFLGTNVTYGTFKVEAYYDVNENNNRDEGEPGLPIEVIIQSIVGGGQLVLAPQTEQLDTNGFYNGVAIEGSIFIFFDNSPDFMNNWLPTEGSFISEGVIEIDVFTEIIKGFYKPDLETGTLIGQLYYDTNENGVQDPGEFSLANIDVSITFSNGLQTTISTDENGEWSILAPAGETISEVDLDDPDLPENVSLTAGQVQTTTDVIANTSTNATARGIYSNEIELSSLSGHLYYDANENGMQDQTEINIEGIGINLESSLGKTRIESNLEGNWEVMVPEGIVTSMIDLDDVDFVEGISQTEGTNPTVTQVSSGSSYEEIDGFYSQVLQIENFSKNNLIIYPNPVNNIIYLDVNKSFLGAQIIDLKGRVIEKISAVENSVDVSKLEQGIYFLKLENYSPIKFIKQ